MTLAAQPAVQPVPFVDLRLQHEGIGAEIRAAVDGVLASGGFVLGPEVTAFEEEYAAFCGVAECVGVGNGTDAIELALRAAGIGPGDEVVVPANTFVATAEAVLAAGAELVLVECTEDHLIDLEDLSGRIGPRTRAVIGVDLYGQVAPFEGIREVVGPDVLLVEDAAQSQGARRHGRPAGSFGAVAATSFYPGKNLGALGDAGAVTTDDGGIARRVRELRNHGGIERYQHDVVGVNSRLDSIQAAVLSLKLRHLAEWNEQRAAAAARYEVLLTGLAEVDGIGVPRVLPGNTHVWHLYVVQVPARDGVVDGLIQRGIGCGVHYPRPVHELPAFADLRLGSFPVAERLARHGLSLPMFPGITPAQQERVVEALTASIREARS